MKTLTIQIEDSLYDRLLKMLKSLPENKIRIEVVDPESHRTFEHAAEYTLEKNKELYQRLS